MCGRPARCQISPTRDIYIAARRGAFARAGELLLEMEKNKGTRGQLAGPCTVQPPDNAPTYADLGVKKHRAIRMQQAGLHRTWMLLIST